MTINIEDTVEISRQAGFHGYCVFVNGLWDTNFAPTPTWEQQFDALPRLIAEMAYIPDDHSDDA